MDSNPLHLFDKEFEYMWDVAVGVDLDLLRGIKDFAYMLEAI